MSETIYVITDGDYSDYHICAVFDDMDLAEKYQNTFGGDDIENWELNPVEQLLRDGVAIWRVEMTRDGDVDMSKFGDVCPVQKSQPDPDELYPQRKWVGGTGPGPVATWILRVETIAKSKEHAVKIANERRAQIIALDRWPKHAPERHEHIIDPLGRFS